VPFVVQTPAAQKEPVAQSVSSVQLPRQVTAPHWYAPQFTSWTPGHAPAPLQPAARTAVPSSQEAARQLVLAEG
jgi:hypothetical protein